MKHKMTTTHILGDKVPRKSNFDPDLARKITKYYEEHPEELKDKPQVPAKSTDINEQQNSKYILMPQTDTYALGVHALHEQCRKEDNLGQPFFELPNGWSTYRPNTFLENILARINNFNTVNNPDGTPRSREDRLSFFNTWLDSCCGIAYQRRSTVIKLNLKCLELICIDKEFKGEYLPVDYASFPHQVKLDSNRSNFKRDGWMALLEERTDVYTEYLKVLEEVYLKKITPGFWVLSLYSLDNDQLRKIHVEKARGTFSDAYGYGEKKGRFLIRSPSWSKK